MSIALGGIRLDRHQGHDSHSYTLHVGRVTIPLSPEELAQLVREAWQHERPLSPKQLDELLKQIRTIRSERGAR